MADAPGEILATVVSQLAVIVPVATVLAILFRRSGTPGSRAAPALLGGLVAGLLLGPGVFGRVAPEMHNRLFVGGIEEAITLRAMESRHAADLAALRTSGVSTEHIVETQRQQGRAISPLHDALIEARSAHQDRLLHIAIIAAGLIMALGGFSLARRLRHRLRSQDVGPGAAALRAVVIALCTMVSAGGVPALLIFVFERPGFQVIAAWFALFAVLGVAPFACASTLLAAAMALLASLLLSLVAADPMAVGTIVLCSAIGLTTGALLPARVRRTIRQVGGVMQRTVLLATMVAIPALLIDLAIQLQTAQFWLGVLVALFWASDGRWLGAWLGWRLAAPGAGSLWRRSAVIVNGGAGTMQCVLTVLLATAAFETQSLIAGGLIGGTFIELTRGLRLWIARYFDADELPEPPH